MKSTILSIVILASLLATIVSQSQAPDVTFDPLGEVNDLPRIIRVQTEFIEMPHATYTKLMSKPRTSANDTDLRAACAKLVEKGEAGVLETMCVNAVPGQVATTESIAEYIYPTEYEPAYPATQTTTEKGTKTDPGTSSPSPSAFDTKNTGSTFEVEAQIDSNDTIVELRMTPTIVYHIGNVNWGNWKAEGADVPIQMPTFYVLKVKTGATVISGQTSMIGVLSPKNDKGFTDTSRKIMVFVRADLLTVGK